MPKLITVGVIVVVLAVVVVAVALRTLPSASATGDGPIEIEEEPIEAVEPEPFYFPVVDDSIREPIDIDEEVELDDAQ